VKALLVVATMLTVVLAAGCAGRAEGGTTESTIGIHYSKFDRELITARVGQPITITIRNGDPIAHEWIVGTAEVHERHRTGTEPYHDRVPTEVTIPAYSERVTMVSFSEPGDYLYLCHLPGHEAYGMRGVLRVIAR
jgi:uncharacterized cupredoxin-like copper-binding protein